MNISRLPYLFLLLILCISGCRAQDPAQTSHRYTNALINSSSPYLLQHAHNPVNWYPWGEESLTKAKEEKKLMIISVGYAACHWCHVMEHESFEDSLVAAKMNASYVSIKVDREERPDVDQIYMNAAYMINGRGGWPLNAIALPDGRPIFAGTYFPQDEWLKVLDHFAKLQQDKPELLEQAASQITRGIQEMDVSFLNPHQAQWHPDSLNLLAENILGQIDFQKGGLDRAPKFPMPSIHQFLLRHHQQSGNQQAKEAVLTTLDEMQKGGIYDHIGGGFARYSTDAKWKVPHFEKMLYDNAQLVSLYSEAYQLTGEERYRTTVYETLDWIERDMLDASGGFYSSLDADSEGEEGKYYVWTETELQQILGKDVGVLGDYYSVSKNGNWEQSNILHLTQTPEKVATKHNLSVEALMTLIADGKAKLLQARKDRIPPGLDDKVLTAWNGLMLKGYVDAYKAFGEDRFLEKARANARFIQDNMLQADGRLLRNYKSGKASINAFADDYAFVIDAFVALYQATFEEKWLFEAEKMMAYVRQHFFSEKSSMFFFTSDLDDPLITRPKELADNVIPGANSALAKDLYLLGTYLYRDDYLQLSRQMLNNVFADARQNAAYYANWGMLLYWLADTPYEVAVVGEKAEAFRADLAKRFLPNVFLIGGKTEGKLSLLENKLVRGATFIYVCQEKVCQLPVEEVDKALAQMKP
ncbi:MAG: thioredoxin domain-containing protein [Bacteroidota bacterium]